ncbi:hypothetical protein IAT38_002790 [Cryptococcus sp. DSM 104549]
MSPHADPLPSAANPPRDLPNPSPSPLILPLTLAALHPVHHLLFDLLYDLIPHKCALLSRAHYAQLLPAIYGRVVLTDSFMQWLSPKHPLDRDELQKKTILPHIHTVTPS